MFEAWEAAFSEQVATLCSTGSRARMTLRQEFYAGRLAQFGRAELAFLQWESRRGVLDDGGSAWWKAVQLALTTHAALAAEHVRRGTMATDASVARWQRFIERPSPATWHAAHNHDIAAAYIAHEALAHDETRAEQLFQRVVLARLLTMHCLEDGMRLPLLGPVLADPRRRIMRVLLAREDLYPSHYPIAPERAEEMAESYRGHSTAGLDALIAPFVDPIFKASSRSLQLPALTRLKPLQMTRRQATKRQRIVILGGGLGGLAAAYELTREPEWQNHYDITVHQMGWRLGGKMSGGRGDDERIEELGLHLLLGFYHHAFAMFRTVYAERAARQLSPECPYQTLDDVLVPNDSLLFVEYSPSQQRWVNWPVIVPRRPGQAGDGQRGASVSPQLLTLALLGYMAGPHGAHASSLAQRGARAVLRAEKLWRGGLSQNARRMANALRVIDRLLSPLTVRLSRLAARRDDARRVFVAANLLQAIARGVVADVLTDDGRFDWTRIDDIDFRAWLTRHGALPLTCESALVRFFYNASFNNLAQPGAPLGVLAASTAMQFLLLGGSYRGAIFNQLRLGTADTLIMPLYQVLAARGVKFEFFSKATALEVNGDVIDSVTVERQVEVTSMYDPVQQTSSGVPAWPREPRWEHIAPEQREWLRQQHSHGLTLESPRLLNRFAKSRELRRGKDFDHVILAIPPAGLRTIVEPLLRTDTDEARRTRWRQMVEGLRSAQVMSAQLWFKDDLEGLGFARQAWGIARSDAAPNVVTYAPPVFSWMDQSHFLKEQTAGLATPPRFVAAFTNSIDDVPGVLPLERCKQVMNEWLDQHLGWFLPKAIRDHQLDQQRLHGTRESQFYFASDNPSDRYVLASPGTNRWRLTPDGSGYDNLYLAGDWTDFGANFGYMEGTIASAEQAVAALRAKD